MSNLIVVVASMDRMQLPVWSGDPLHQGAKYYHPSRIKI